MNLRIHSWKDDLFDLETDVSGSVKSTLQVIHVILPIYLDDNAHNMGTYYNLTSSYNV